MSISRRHFLIRLIPLVFSLILFTCQERVFKNPHDETSTLDPKSWAPSNLQAQMLADSTIKLTWQHEGGNIDGFKIDKQVGSLTWIHEYALLAKTDREWIDANKVFDTTLTYRLYAYANSNYSAYDSITSFIHSIHGCTDLDAANYNPEAQVDDGSCIYPLIVISPKGEEEWLIGSEQTITWERNDLSRMIGGDFDLPQNKLITKKKRADKKSKTVINRQKNPQVPIMKGNKKPTMARSNIKGKIQELNGTMPLTVNNKNGKVKIELYADGTVYAIIKNSTDDDGSYSWMITPDTYSGGSTFKIRITDIVDTSVYAESENYFTLIEIPGCTDSHASNYDITATIDDDSCTYDTPTEGLVAWYPFNGNAEDASGNGNDGDINEGTDSEATLTTDRFGNDNSAYSFDGVDDFVALTSPFNTVDDLDGTLCVWFNTLQQSAGWIIGQDFSGSNRDWWFTSNRNNAGRLVFMIDDTADNNREVESDPGNDLSDGQWHQVCGLWGDTGMSMYIDGTLQSNTNAYDIYPNTAVASYIGCYRGGTYPSGTSCNGNFDGKVDDIHIYSRALNKIEISKLYCDGGWCIAGCTDPNANNYDENATTDDGSCEYEITEDLVAYYPFNGNADDESGNGNDGDINEGTYSEPILTTDRFGNESSAYSFDGVDDYIDLGNGSQFNFGTGVFSLSAWFQTLTIQDGRILSKTNHEADDGFQLGLSAAIPKFYLLDSNPVASSDVTLNDNIWHNLVGIRSGDQLQLYVDGVLEHTVIGVVGYDVSSNNTLKIGKRDGTQDLPFQGNIDDIHIYNHALNETEITELYCDGGWCEHQSLVAYYPFNGNANDESGNGNDGDINEETDSEPTLTTDRFGNENSAYSFDGINDFIVIDPEFSYSNEISMGGWLKIDALSKGITIVSKRFGNFGGEDFQLYYEGPGDYKMVGILWGLSTERCRGTINSVIDNDWHHYFFTYDGSFMVMYIDGVINQTCTSSGTVNNNNLNMRIGEDWYGNYGDGDIDEVRIYNRALSASEVQALYQQ